MRPKLLIPLLILACAAVSSASDRATAVGKDLRIDGPVDGDAVVIVGDLTLGSSASVTGDAIAILGTVVQEPGAVVEGRTIAVTSLATLDLDPNVHRQPGTTAMGLVLLSVGGWLAVITALAYLMPRMTARGIAGVMALSWRLPVLGLLTVATVVAALVAVLGLGPNLGVPMAAVIIAFFVALKALGLAILGGIVGRFVLDRIGFEDAPLPSHVLFGALPLILIRFVPAVGGPTWSLISILAWGGGFFAVIAAWLARSADAELGSVSR
jgi:hypothetical protein